MRLACCQSNVVFGDPASNAAKAVSTLERLKEDGVDFVVFPEAYLTGYCVDNPSSAAEIAIPSSHESLAQIHAACQRLDILAVVGFAEVRDGKLYNTAALFEPGKGSRYYSKTHLPCLGYDRFALTGDELPVFDTRFGRIGILICFDLRPPEAARVLALKGADLIILPTNWPEGAWVAPEHMALSRAAENKVFFATCDRVGAENGFKFIGLSKIVSPMGRPLAEAGIEEEIIQADLQLELARNKTNVVIPGKYETTVFESRRPELYRALSEPATTSPAQGGI